MTTFSQKITEKLTRFHFALPHIEVVETLNAELFKSLAQQRRVTIVSDTNTHIALGKRITEMLRGDVQEVILPLPFFASVAQAESLMAQLDNTELLVAVGSGTINDLCKYASFQRNIPYAVLPTAASMNGYLSASASLIKDGLKQSLPAHLPQAVVCDMAVIAAAPKRLTQAGFGDSMARSTAQIDWLLSHLLLETTYNSSVFELTAEVERELIACAEGLAKGEKSAVTLLMQLLLLSGLAMTECKGSYPASQGEHMIAHCYEMLSGAQDEALHGEQIAMTTLYMAKHQDMLFNPRLTPFALAPLPHDSDFDMNGLPPALQAIIERESKNKAVSVGSLPELQQKVNRQWPQICARLQAISLPYPQLEMVLKQSGCATTASAIGWDKKRFFQAVELARFSRNRFTFLDLAAQ